MDVRRQQLVTAADAVRAWVHAQRATWDNPYLYTTMPVAQAAALPAASEPSPTITAELPADIPTAEWPSAGSLKIRSAIGRIAGVLADGLPAGWPSWRVAAAAVLVLLTAGVARLFWPGWTRPIERERAAERQVLDTGRTAVQGGRAVDAGREVVENGRRVVGAAGTPATGAAGQTTGGLQLETDPPGATILIDGRERGVTPLTLGDLPPKTYNVLFKADAGSVQHKVVVTAGQTTRVADAIFSGWLKVIAPIEVLVSEGPRGLQLDDSGQVLLTPGAHDILIENRSLGFQKLHHVSVRPGDTTTIAVELPPSTLTVTATEPAEVAIDGEAAGAAPLIDYPVHMGTRELTVTGASGVVRRIVVEITGQPARVDVDFTAP